MPVYPVCSQTGGCTPAAYLQNPAYEDASFPSHKQYKYPENDFNEYSAEIGYSVLKKWQQQGIASEILPPLIHFGKEYLGFTKIVTRIEKNNIASIRLAKKNNLKILICQATEQTNS